MDTTTHRPVTNDLVSSPAASSFPPEEATGDSESDAEVSVDRTAGHSSETDDDAESCSGGYYIDGAAKDADDESDVTEDVDDVGMDEEVDMTEVDSKMALPWWRRTVVEYAAKAADAGCRPAAAELGRKLTAEGGHAASESNDRLFWEACIAHGY